MTVRHFLAHTLRRYLAGGRTKAMVETNTLVISGPMNAQHVGGVNVLGSSSSGLNNYFPSSAIVPDERPSHTFVATGMTEAPRRPDPVAGTFRRSSVSLRRSLSKLRRNPSLHHAEAILDSGKDHKVERSDSTSRPLRMQSSMSRLRQRVGMDRELYDTASTSKTSTFEPQNISESMLQNNLEPQDARALTRLTTISSFYPAIDSGLSQTKAARKQQHLVVQRRPSPLERQTSPADVQRPARSRRADSGTAIDLRRIPVHERPIPFKEIMSVSSLDERMAMYKKTREYWAHADHGLVAWTERAARPKAAIPWS